MTTKKIVIATALLLSATSAALAQSAWTTGTASDRDRAGYASPGGGGLYAGRAVAPRENGRSAFAMVPAPAGSRSGALSPAATGGGSLGYNENLRRDAW